MNQHQHIIDDLLVKYLLGEADPEEIRNVQDWLSADPANQRHFEQVRLIWEKSLRLHPPHDAPLRNIDNPEGDEDRAWTRLRQRIHTKKSPSIPLWTRVAASLLLPVLIAGLTWWWSIHRYTPPQIARSGEHTLSDTLSDGSVILLNKHSSLVATEKRTVHLRGEAFFTVTPNKTQPFIVHAGTTTVTVLGTSFNIQMDAGKTTIQVETGQIKVTNLDNTILLNAGEQISFNPHEDVLTKEPINGSFYHYYRPLEFDCKETPLEELVQALNTAYDAHIEIGNPGLNQLRITTTFNNDSLDHILSVLSATFKLQVQHTNNRIILH